MYNVSKDEDDEDNIAPQQKMRDLTKSQAQNVRVVEVFCPNIEGGWDSIESQKLVEKPQKYIPIFCIIMIHDLQNHLSF